MRTYKGPELLPSIPMEVTAKDLAKAAHHGQKYGEYSYMIHVNSVASQVIQLFGGSEDLKDVAYLHDVLEDNKDFTPEVLRKYGVPENVIQSVILLSKNYCEGGYEDYIEGLLENWRNGDQVAWKVKVADTLSNLAASVMSDEPKRVLKYTKQLNMLYGG